MQRKDKQMLAESKNKKKKKHVDEHHNLCSGVENKGNKARFVEFNLTSVVGFLFCWPAKKEPINGVIVSQEMSCFASFSIAISSHFHCECSYITLHCLALFSLVE